MHNKTNPPKLLLRFFQWFCHPDYLEDIEGDLLERFERNINEQGYKKARIEFFKEVVKLFRLGIIRPMEGVRRLNFYGMLKNYFKVAPRIFLRNKLVSSVSLLSLILGAVSFQLIFAWVNNELNVDSFHHQRDDIYLITMKTNPMAKLRAGMYKVEPNQYPSVKSSLTIQKYGAEEGKLVYNDKEFRGEAWVVDSTFFDFFDFPLAFGSTDKVLRNPTDIIISKSLAKRIFGEKESIGESLKLLIDNNGVYQIAGILEDMPSNSSIKFDILIPRHSQKRWGRLSKNLILVDENFNQERFNNQIADKGRFKKQFPENRLGTIAFNSLYFNNNFDFGILNKKGNMNQVWIMIFISFLVVFVSTINFTNLLTVLQLSTIKPLVIRHVNGASKLDLVIQSIINKLLQFSVAIIISTILIYFLFPFYEQIINTQIDFNLSDCLLNITIVLTIIVTISIIFSIAQIYKIKITDAFQGRLVKAKIPTIQRVLITLQYAIVIFLIIASVVVYKQFSYLMNQDLGYDSQNIISINFFDEFDFRKYESEDDFKKAWEDGKSKFEYVWNKLESHPDILELAQGDLPIQGVAYAMDWKPIDSIHEFSTQKIITFGNNYDKLLGLEIIKGRFFNDSIDNDRDTKVVINEVAARHWNIEDIENIQLKSASWGDFEVIGIVKNFNYEHLSSSINPIVLMYMSGMDDSFLMKIKKDKLQNSLSFIQDLYNEVNPSGQFEYTLLEDELAKQYEQEKLIGNIYFGFTIIALSLSLIGLFTFAMYENTRRTKEMGIRKVHGAKVREIFSNLSASFIRIIIIAILLAFPTAYYLVNKWLENYAHRVDIGILPFISTAIIVSIIVLLAIGWQTLSIAKQNPIHALRDE